MTTGSTFPFEVGIMPKLRVVRHAATQPSDSSYRLAPSANKYSFDNDTVQRFWASIEKTAACWNWLKDLNNRGYGRFYSKGVTFSAHRLSYELFVGRIPDGLTIDHLCRNKKCVNPYHLEAVTGKENTLRGDAAPSINAKKTHCKNGHILAGDNLKEKWYSGRYERLCITCNRNFQREWARKRRADKKAALAQPTPEKEKKG